jgi:hypothetical protein
MSISDLYYTREQAAAYLNRCVETLDRWRKAGTGPAPTLINRSVFYRKVSLHQWLEGQERVPFPPLQAVVDLHAKVAR